MKCQGPECARDATVSTVIGTGRGKEWQLCRGHYAQARRHGIKDMKPLREEGGENDAQMSFRVPSVLKSQAEKDAKRWGMTETEWWRAAAWAYLDSGDE